jgi:hypothetical protein
MMSEWSVHYVKDNKKDVKTVIDELIVYWKTESEAAKCDDLLWLELIPNTKWQSESRESETNCVTKMH